MPNRCHYRLEWGYVACLVNEQRTRFSVQHTVLVEHKLFYRLAERAVLLTQSPIAWHTTPHAVLLNGADGI